MTTFTLRAISAMLTLLYTLLTFTHCTQQGQTGGTGPVADVSSIDRADPVTVRILNPYPEISLALQEAADLFLNSRSDAQIHVRSVEGAEEYKLARRAALTDNEVELFHLFGYHDLSTLGGYAKDLSGISWTDSALDFTLEPVQSDSGTYGIPYSVEGVGLIANRNIFEAAGIPLSDINDFEGLSEAYTDLREQIDGGELEERFENLQYVTEFPALDKSFLGEQVADLMLTGSFASPKLAGDARAASFPLSGGVEEYLQLTARYSGSRADWAGLCAVAQNYQVESGLASGRVAIIQQNTNICERVYRIDESLSGRLALLPIPLGEGEEGVVYAGTPSWWAVNAEADDEAAVLAIEFLTWLYQSETGTTFLANRMGILSPYRETAKTTGVGLHDQLLSYIEAGEVRPWLHQEAPDGWGTQVLAAAVQDYFQDLKNWSEVEEVCAEEWRISRKR